MEHSEWETQHNLKDLNITNMFTDLAAIKSTIHTAPMFQRRNVMGSFTFYTEAVRSVSMLSRGTATRRMCCGGMRFEFRPEHRLF